MRRSADVKVNVNRAGQDVFAARIDHFTRFNHRVWLKQRRDFITAQRHLEPPRSVGRYHRCAAN